MAEDIDNALEAMLDGNRVRFNEIIADIMANRAADAVSAKRDEMSQTVFNFDDPDEYESDIEDLEDMEEEEEETSED